MAADFVTKQDANWDLERGAFNILIDQEPAGIAIPRSADDVSDVVRSAAADGKRVAAQCTGHLAAPLGSLADTVLLRTAGLTALFRSTALRAVPESAPAPSGATWCLGHPSWASPPCTARPQASASPATRLAAA